MFAAAFLLLAFLAPTRAATPVLAAACPVARPLPSSRLEDVHHRAQIAWQAGDPQGAVALVRDYLRAVRRPPPGVGADGWIWLRADWFGPASPRACGALPADPRVVDHLVDFGFWLEHTGDARGAVDLLEAVLVDAPDDADAQLIVAEGRLALGDVADARRHAARYLALTAGVPSS